MTVGDDARLRIKAAAGTRPIRRSSAADDAPGVNVICAGTFLAAIGDVRMVPHVLGP
jgi:hypothetical protein